MSGHNTGAVLNGQVTHRGTSNTNDRGSTADRRRRREWLVETYKADRSLVRIEWAQGQTTVEAYVVSIEQLLAYDSVLSAEAVPTCRCYRCGRLLTADTVTVDRIIPGCLGGTYRRDNIRPACGDCNSKTGAKGPRPSRRSRS